MSSVTSAVIGVIIRHRRVVACVVVANKIVPIGHKVSLTETASKSRVKVVDASIDDGDLDTGASVTGSAQLVNLRLHVS